MNEEERRLFWKAFYENQEAIKRKAEEMRQAKREPGDVFLSESPETPFEAVVYFQGVSSYTAEIWSTKQIKINEPLVRYTYWIVITDPGFAGREIKDSFQSDNSKLDIRFKDMGLRDIQGFQYRHFAGSSFRVRFTLDIETGKVISQDLTF